MSESLCGPAAAAGQQEEAVDGMLCGQSDTKVLPFPPAALSVFFSVQRSSSASLKPGMGKLFDWWDRGGRSRR